MYQKICFCGRSETNENKTPVTEVQKKEIKTKANKSKFMCEKN